jgi:hypothetical protein
MRFPGRDGADPTGRFRQVDRVEVSFQRWPGWYGFIELARAVPSSRRPTRRFLGDVATVMLHLLTVILFTIPVLCDVVDASPRNAQRATTGLDDARLPVAGGRRRKAHVEGFRFGLRC